MPMQHETGFDYTIYVAATPERIWRALTDPEDTRRYWRHREAGGKTFPSDWQPGSTWSLVHGDIGLVVDDPAMVIFESDPPRRLSYAWHTFTEEWAEAVGLDSAAAAAWRAEPRSRVRYDLEATTQGVTRLTVVHDGFAPGSVVLPNIAQGWPAVFSSLKSMVETGSPLP
jgi:uncharacterized protein YndB with AHSA1/START domain